MPHAVVTHRHDTQEPHHVDTPHTTEQGRVLLTVEAAAQQLTIGRTSMYALIKAGHIASVRIGHLRRVPAEALTAYVQQLTANQAEAA